MTNILLAAERNFGRDRIVETFSVLSRLQKRGFRPKTRYDRIPEAARVLSRQKNNK